LKDIFHNDVKNIDENILKYIVTNVSVFFKIPSPKIRKEYSMREIIEMFIDILYYNKHSEK